MSDIHPRQLSGYLLDLLDPEERAAVESALAADPALAADLERLRGRALGWARDEDSHPEPSRLAALLEPGPTGGPEAGEAAALTEHLLACEDCRMLAQAAREDLAGAAADAIPIGAVSRPTGRRRRARPLAWAAGIAAGLLAGFLAGHQMAPSPAPVALPALPLHLGASRGSGEALELRLSQVPAGGLALLVETRLPAGRHAWELAVDSEILAGGELDLPASASDLRRLALPVPRSALARGGHLVLRILPADGAPARTWSFHLDVP